MEVKMYKEHQGPEMMVFDAKELSFEDPLHFRLSSYTWPQKSLSVGCLFDPSTLLDLEMVKKEGWSLYKRPTGGGVMFHGNDLCFSLVVGSSHPLFSMGVLESYHYIHERIKWALFQRAPYLQGKIYLCPQKEIVSTTVSQGQRCCLFEPTVYDLMLEDKKIVGCAQRRKKTLLHQISLGFRPVVGVLLKKLFRDPDELATIIEQNYGALGLYLEDDPEKIHREIAEDLKKSLDFFSE